MILTIVVLVQCTYPAYAERVCAVHDGDTLKLCNGQSIRLWGIDAPELKQPFGRQSRDYLRTITRDREFTLTCKGRSWKRKVCMVQAGGLDVQREMVGWGLAYDSPQYSKGAYRESERFAQEQNRGVWTLPGGGVRPWNWRRHSKIKE